MKGTREGEASVYEHHHYDSSSSSEGGSVDSNIKGR